MFMVLSSAIARVHPVHLMNVEWRQVAAEVNGKLGNGKLGNGKLGNGKLGNRKIRQR